MPCHLISIAFPRGWNGICDALLPHGWRCGWCMGCLGLGCGHGEGCRMSLWQLHRAYPASWTWCLSERYVLCSPMHLVSTISWIKVGVSVPKCFSPPNIFWLCDPRLLALNYWATLCHCVWIMIAFMWLNLAAWIYPNIEFQSPPGLLGLLANPVMKVWNPVTCFVSEWGSWRNIQCRLWSSCIHTVWKGQLRWAKSILQPSEILLMIY